MKIFHAQERVVNGFGNCSWQVIKSISFDEMQDPRKFVSSASSGGIWSTDKNPHVPAFYVFSLSGNKGSQSDVSKLRNYIEEHNLGKIISSSVRVNMNPAHNFNPAVTSQIHIWEVNHDELKKWKETRETKNIY